MKKCFSLLLVLLLLLSAAGCADIDIVAEIKNFDLSALLNNEPDWNTVVVEEIAAGSPFKYYFRQLGSKERQAYNNILAEIDKMPKSIEIPSLSQSELSTVFEALLYDNPYLFYLGRSCTITKTGLKSYFNAEYIMSVTEYTKRAGQLSGAVDSILAGAGNKNEFDTELFIHDYVVNNCSYENSGIEDESTAYGALIGKKAACEGYSKAAKALLDKAGIDCYVVSGMSSNYQEQAESHMWNIVRINGQYYHLDLTWDDPVTINQSEKNDPRYTYFNITDKEIAKTHTGFKSVNACTAKTANYFIVKELYFTQYNSAARTRIAAALAGLAGKGTGSLELEVKFSTADIYKQAFKGLFDNQQVYDIIAAADRATGKDLSSPSVSYIQNKNFGIIELIIAY